MVAFEKEALERLAMAGKNAGRFENDHGMKERSTVMSVMRSKLKAS